LSGIPEECNTTSLQFLSSSSKQTSRNYHYSDKNKNQERKKGKKKKKITDRDSIYANYFLKLSANIFPPRDIQYYANSRLAASNEKIISAEKKSGSPPTSQTTKYKQPFAQKS